MLLLEDRDLIKDLMGFLDRILMTAKLVHSYKNGPSQEHGCVVQYYDKLDLKIDERTEFDKQMVSLTRSGFQCIVTYRRTSEGQVKVVVEVNTRRALETILLEYRYLL